MMELTSEHQINLLPCALGNTHNLHTGRGPRVWSALGKVPFGFSPATSLLLPALLSLGHFGLFSLKSRWPIIICLALPANVLSLLCVLQVFSLWFSKTQCRCWKFRSTILMADLLRLLEATVPFQDWLLFLSASTPITSCHLQLRGVKLSRLLLGCLRSKRKQRPYFLVILLCLAVLRRGGHLWVFSLASCWPRKAPEQQREVFGLRMSPISSLKRNNWVYARRE